MVELDTYQQNAAQRARTASLRELLVSLDTYARDIEAEGRTMAPAFIREAARRLEADAQALADVRTLDSAGAHVARDCGMWRLYRPMSVEWLPEHDATPDEARALAAARVREQAAPAAEGR